MLSPIVRQRDFVLLRSSYRRFDMLRWNPRFVRVVAALGAFVSLAIASGAGARWS
jgi:hypothetical protein